MGLGAEKKVLWNDRRDGRFVCHRRCHGRAAGRFPPDLFGQPRRQSAVTAIFARPLASGQGYGYAGLEARGRTNWPEDSRWGIEASIWRPAVRG